MGGGGGGVKGKYYVDNRNSQYRQKPCLSSMHGRHVPNNHNESISKIYVVQFSSYLPEGLTIDLDIYLQ